MATRARSVRASTAASSAATPARKTASKPATPKGKGPKKGYKAMEAKRVDTVISEVAELKDMFQQFMAAQGTAAHPIASPERAAPILEEEEELEEWEDEGLIEEEPVPIAPRPRKSVARPLASRHSNRKVAAARTAKAARVAPVVMEDSSDDDDEELPTTYKGKRPRNVSGLLRTAATVKPKFLVQWPHEKSLYKQGATPPSYQDLSLDQFVRGFIVTSLKAPQDELVHRLRYLADLMADCRVRSWEKVRDFHAVWMQELEQGEASWDTSRELLGVIKLRHLYLHAESMKGADPEADSKTTKPSSKDPMAPCKDFNSEAGCKYSISHDRQKHCCSYCAQNRDRFFPHSRVDCTSVKYSK